MRTKLIVFLAATLLCFANGPVHAWAAASSTFTGGGWTLTVASHQMSYGLTLRGTFHSARKSFEVQGDWIPAGDAGSDLLRFYGHPFGPKSGMGLVGLATLANLCLPNCASSKTYELKVLVGQTQLPTVLPGVGKRSIILHYRG